MHSDSITSPCLFLEFTAMSLLNSDEICSSSRSGIIRDPLSAELLFRSSPVGQFWKFPVVDEPLFVLHDAVPALYTLSNLGSGILIFSRSDFDKQKV